MGHGLETDNGTFERIHLLRCDGCKVLREPNAPNSVQRSVWMKQDLGVALDALVELVISHRGVINSKLVGYHEAGLSTTGDDEVT